MRKFGVVAYVRDNRIEDILILSDVAKAKERFVTEAKNYNYGGGCTKEEMEFELMDSDNLTLTINEELNLCYQEVTFTD